MLQLLFCFLGFSITGFQASFRDFITKNGAEKSAPFDYFSLN